MHRIFFLNNMAPKAIDNPAHMHSRNGRIVSNSVTRCDHFHIKKAKNVHQLGSLPSSLCGHTQLQASTVLVFFSFHLVRVCLCVFVSVVSSSFHTKLKFLCQEILRSFLLRCLYCF